MSERNGCAVMCRCRVPVRMVTATQEKNMSIFGPPQAKNFRGAFSPPQAKNFGAKNLIYVKK